MTKQIIGVYDTEKEAVQTIENLKQRGYREEDISIFGRDRRDVSRIANETGTSESYAANTDDTVVDIGDVATVIDGIAAAFGAVTVATGDGGLVDALIAAGISEEQARRYESEVNEGKILVLADSARTSYTD
jgi:hypothetical protein